jgi:hypothetical protein
VLDAWECKNPPSPARDGSKPWARPPHDAAYRRSPPDAKLDQLTFDAHPQLWFPLRDGRSVRPSLLAEGGRPSRH